jgi:hypothetical protein
MLPAVPTNQFIGTAGNTSRLYKIDLEGRSGNHSYKCMICRDGMVGTAGRAASTKPHQPSLEIIRVVV